MTIPNCGSCTGCLRMLPPYCASAHVDTPRGKTCSPSLPEAGVRNPTLLLPLRPISTSSLHMVSQNPQSLEYHSFPASTMGSFRLTVLFRNSTIFPMTNHSHQCHRGFIDTSLSSPPPCTQLLDDEGPSSKPESSTVPFSSAHFAEGAPTDFKMVAQPFRSGLRCPSVASIGLLGACP